MDREALVAELRDMRKEIDRLIQDPWSPAVERSLSLVDMHLHLALWHLGEVEEVTPERGAPGLRSGRLSGIRPSESEEGDSV